MIQLLFLVLIAEGIVALFLMLKIGPLRELAMKGLDQLKQGRGPATMKTIACTMSMILLSSITSIIKIQNKGAKLGTLTPMDQVLWRTHLLEASLIGYTLFLGFIIDHLHYHLHKMTRLKTTVGASKQEIENLKKEQLQFQEKDQKEIRLLKEEIAKLTEILKKMQLDSEEKDKKVESAEAHVLSLQKQSEDLLLEYDRLLEDNQHLQTQAMGYR